MKVSYVLCMNTSFSCSPGIWCTLLHIIQFNISPVHAVRLVRQVFLFNISYKIIKILIVYHYISPETARDTQSQRSCMSLEFLCCCTFVHYTTPCVTLKIMPGWYVVSWVAWQPYCIDILSSEALDLSTIILHLIIQFHVASSRETLVVIVLHCTSLEQSGL